jgi:hypothetical protein
MKILYPKLRTAPGAGPHQQQLLSKHFDGSNYIKDIPVYLRKPKRELLPPPREFFSSEIDGLKEYSDGWAWGCCPFHSDSKPSFTVNLETGVFRCMSSACGVHGGSVISYVEQLHDLETPDAITYLRRWK